jgi:hypothetical protein
MQMSGEIKTAEQSWDKFRIITDREELYAKGR